MEHLRQLTRRIVNRININLRGPKVDCGPYALEIVPEEKFTQFYAFYGLSPDLPLHLKFKDCCLAGSYFLGRCTAEHSLIYKTDIRGDEFKRKGTRFDYEGLSIPLHHDEKVVIKDSFLVKTLVHNFSHDPENLEEFRIKNTFSTHYANIHGAPMEGAFLGPFSTVDLTSLHDCVVGTFAYVQVGELSHEWIEPGMVWVRSEGNFDFRYRFPLEPLKKYIDLKPHKRPTGILFDFVESKKQEFESIYCRVQNQPPFSTQGASVSPYAVVKPKTLIGENVLVAQRAYIENSSLGRGSNAQENCYIIDSTLKGNNVTAHGGKIISSILGENVFVGFNAFLHGKEEALITIGKNSIIMPHAIIDAKEPVTIPENTLAWGLITCQKDLKQNSVCLDELAEVDGKLELGSMVFQGHGKAFVDAFRHRITHILEANGAFYTGQDMDGHAQKGQDISFNIIQPYAEGPLRGMYPTMDISHLED
jgi:carbonic anhydrase/acetyltransferase-like protein (isoleucine patch superfamily)